MVTVKIIVLMMVMGVVVVMVRKVKTPFSLEH